MYKILSSSWRVGMIHTVGFVAIETARGWKAYVGAIDTSSTSSIEEDEQTIAKNGAKLSQKEAAAFFPFLSCSHREYGE